MNREGTLHIIRTAELASGDYASRIGFADYASPGGAMMMKEVKGRKALQNFLTSIGIGPSIIQSALEGLSKEGTASILSVLLPESELLRLGLVDSTPLPVFPIRFTVFREPSGPILSFSPALPFTSASLSSKARVQFRSVECLIRALNEAGLPGGQIVDGIDPSLTYSVNRAQLASLGFRL